ncbi:unnamed protein product [Lathyrus sativus]|nr:unnamed protein product [Lathyrus sativus]
MMETMQPQKQRDEGEASFSSSHNHNHVSPSPSFSSYSSETLAEIAARVIDELRWDPHSVSDDDALYQPWENDVTFAATPNEDEDAGSEFEFAVVSTDTANFPVVSADDIFYNGQIKPLYYPIFDQNLLNDEDAVSSVTVSNETTPRRRLPLRTLMFEDNETTVSCSSSTDESVDVEAVAEGSYCVWNPNSVGIERKKSSSAGSGSKRWKLRNLLLRSHSDGKDKQPVMFQIPKTTASKGSPSVEHDGKNQSKRKSFLTYRPELVGLFANVNGLGRNLNPF